MRQRADQDRGQDGGGDLGQSHLEALIDPVGAVVGGEDDQRDDDEKQDDCPDVFGREESF
jgi:hypothetical protein